MSNYFKLDSEQTDSVYFANKPAEDCANVLMAKAQSWLNVMENNYYLEKIRRCWAAYYGAYLGDMASGHEITFTGEQEELVNLPVNHFRNIVQHILSMTTSTRPSLDAKAINTDYKSLTQTILANGILEYYLREKGLEEIFKRAIEYAVVLGSGYVKMGWDAYAGEIYDYADDGSPLYEGDVTFVNLSPFDVIVDGSKEDNNHDWMLTRCYKNKFDLAAKYPELFDEIISIPSKNDLNKYRFLTLTTDQTDDISLFEFYHKKTESVPNGRYMLICGENTVLYDGDLPYRFIPVFRVSPSDIMGTPYGYTNMFDLLPLQEAVTSLYSTIMTNNSAFGVQNILVPRGSDINYTQLAGGLNAIDYNPQVGEPKPLQLTATSPETYQFLGQLVKDMETLSGVNSVTRGSPDSSLKSGTSLAMVQSMAIQFISALQGNYVILCERVGTGLIKMLQDFAVTKRAITVIAGKSNRTLVQEFSSDSISSINRVAVSIGNPLARTTAGRVEMAKELLQMGLIKTAAEYIMVINTGELDTMYEGENHELLLIRSENERMMTKEPVSVISIDAHKTHIVEHKALLADPDLRADEDLVKIVTDHIQAHINALRTTQPDLLQLIGEQPLNPPQAPGPMPGPHPMPPGPPGAPPMGPPPGPPGPPPPPGPQGPPQGAPIPPKHPGAPKGEPHTQHVAANATAHMKGQHSAGPRPAPVSNILAAPAAGQQGVMPNGNHLQGPGLSATGALLPQLPQAPGAFKNMPILGTDIPPR